MKGMALFLTDEFKDDIVVNEKIVVILSNGKKYMGKVVSFTYAVKGKVIEGYLELIKV